MNEGRESAHTNKVQREWVVNKSKKWNEAQRQKEETRKIERARETEREKQVNVEIDKTKRRKVYRREKDLKNKQF